jgi:hypothetical protein
VFVRRTGNKTLLLAISLRLVCDKESFAFTTRGFYELFVFNVKREFDGVPVLSCQ